MFGSFLLTCVISLKALSVQFEKQGEVKHLPSSTAKVCLIILNESVTWGKFYLCFLILQALRSVVIIKLCKGNMGQHVHDK